VAAILNNLADSMDWVMFWHPFANDQAFESFQPFVIFLLNFLTRVQHELEQLSIFATS
jgi:hypothetical protein